MSNIIERAKAALEGVTEGPWRWDGDSFSDVKPHLCPHNTEWCDHGPDLERVTDYDESDEWDTPANGVITSYGYDASGLEIKRADAEFIAAARQLVPELIAEVEKWRAAAVYAHVDLGALQAMKSERDEMRAEVERLRQQRTIETAAELDALPPRAVIRSGTTVYELVAVDAGRRSSEPDHQWWTDGAWDAAFGPNDLPARLLWHPEWGNA